MALRKVEGSKLTYHLWQPTHDEHDAQEGHHSGESSFLRRSVFPAIFYPAVIHSRTTRPPNQLLPSRAQFRQFPKDHSVAISDNYAYCNTYWAGVGLVS